VVVKELVQLSTKTTGTGETKAMSEWLAFKVKAKGKGFTDALAAFKATVPSTSRRWDASHGYWVFDPRFTDQVAPIGEVTGTTSLCEDDLRHGRRAVADDEMLDAGLVDLQYGDLVAGDGIRRVQGDKAGRAEFERQLREAES
jgi:hypothetical protein